MSVVRTDQSLVDKEAQSQLDGKTRSASKVFCHQWSMDAEKVPMHRNSMHSATLFLESMERHPQTIATQSLSFGTNSEISPHHRHGKTVPVTIFSREQPSVLMWTSQSHAAVGLPSRINSEITPLQAFTFRVLWETILGKTVLLDSCVRMFRHQHFNA